MTNTKLLLVINDLIIVLGRSVIGKTVTLLKINYLQLQVLHTLRCYTTIQMNGVVNMLSWLLQTYYCRLFYVFKLLKKHQQILLSQFSPCCSPYILMELTRRICLTIKTSHPWRSFPLFSSLECLNKW